MTRPEAERIVRSIADGDVPRGHLQLGAAEFFVAVCVVLAWLIDKVVYGETD